jgi:hypothetical protein
VSDLAAELVAARAAGVAAERELRQAAAVIDAELLRLRLVLARVSRSIEQLEERRAVALAFVAGSAPGEAHV